MLLPALQTAPTAAGDDRIDTLTLVLVVMFIVAMLALSLVMRSRESERPVDPPVEPQRPQPVADAFSVARRTQPASTPSEPVWLRGVIIPAADGALTDAVRTIEALLAARRNQDIAAGLDRYTPDARAALRERLGIERHDPDAIRFDGSPPALRSAEIIETLGDRMRVRATYSDAASEVYTLIWLDGGWFIEAISGAR